MSGLVLVGCCGPKLGVRAPAKDLYQSQLFRLARAWAEEHGDSWAVLSARHGVVAPETELDPYNQTIDRMTRRARAAWVASVVNGLAKLGASELTFLAGRNYTRPVIEQLLANGSAYRPSKISEPLAGLGIGQRKAWLAKHTATPTAWVTA